ncbi:Fungal specific transcription factor domain-containing protein isoform 2 [Cladophialophora immunda]|nr:Fungal specific transcription factor domain-containing protein isoform 2 [Cladophialophora immunda]
MHQPDRVVDDVHSAHQTDRAQQRRQKAVDPDWTSAKNGISQADQASEANDPPSKRRRVALACTVCRGRKSRCDGMRPKCSLCIELGFECVYQQSASYSNIIIGKEYLSSIEDRLKEVEGRLASLEHRERTAVYQPARPNVSNGVSRSDFAQPETACLREESLEDAETVEDPIDAMGAVTFAQEEDCAFFGPSSNIAFLRHVSRAVARLTHDPEPWKPSPAEHHSVGFTGGFINTSGPASPIPTPHDPPLEQVNIYALPPDSVARELLNWYFSNTGLLFPYINEQSFMATFEQASKDKFKGVRRVWLALLNIVFAHAMVHARENTTTPGSVESTAAKASAESEIYFRRASGLFNEKNANGTGTSVEVVQFLLLMGQYLQGTQKSVQTWKTHGLAVRAAFQIGLHSSDLARVFPPLEQEVRKRTWFGCIMLDRTLSMTFGRPPAIPDSYVQLELPVGFSAVDGGSAATDKKEALSIAFFNGTITLYKVLCTIIDSLYGQNLACSFKANAVDTVALVYKIENQLSEWQRGLPSHMRLIATQDILPERLPHVESSAEEAWRQLRLRFILTLRYTNVRILLHRPVLVKFLDGLSNPANHQDTSLLQQVGTIHIQIAIKSAKEIICLVHNALQSATGRSKWGLLGAWWFSLYYTFNAALVLGACVLVQIDQKASGNESNMSLTESTEDMSLHLEMAIEAIRHLDSDNRMVARCRDYLEQFVQVVQALAIGQGLLPQPHDWQPVTYHHPTNPSAYGQVPQPPPPHHEGGDYGVLLGGGAAAVGASVGMGIYNHSSGIVASSKQSPLGMELGEFMLDGDLEFLSSHSFAYNRGVAP